MLNLLIKPTSSACNINCGYCFYKASVNNPLTKMSIDTIETLIRKAFESGKTSISFAFQGGEPTLAGLDFFKEVIKLQKRFNKNKVLVSNSIQTNGVLIDEAWATFFKEEKFLVGLSLDGYEELHNKYRKKINGEGSFKDVIATKELFHKLGVEYNILSVITKEASKRVEKLYKFYKENNIEFCQFIPCLDSGICQNGKHEFSLTPLEYETFLKQFFDLWYKDYQNGSFISVRLFENICAMILGYESESCEMRGYCSIQNVIEANGDIYPCDFYVCEKERIGNINEISFGDIEKSLPKIEFVKVKEPLDKCKRCKYGALCKGGCKRYRDELTGGYYYCRSFKNFYDYTIDRFIHICKDIVKRQKV